MKTNRKASVSILLVCALVIGFLQVHPIQAAKKISISSKSASLKVGQKKQLKLKKGSKAVTKGVKWSSSNKKVATVTSKGKVTAKKAGSATIKAKYKKKTYKCKVTVTSKASNNNSSDSSSSNSGSSSNSNNSSDSSSSNNNSTATATPVPTATPTPVPTATPTPVPTVEPDNFDFEKDCTVTTGEENIYIEFEINKDSVSEEELKEEGYDVENGVASATVTCETATYEFSKLPTTLEGIQRIPLDTKFGPVAASICSVAAIDTTQLDNAPVYMYTLPIFDMMDYLNGPTLTISNVSKSSMYSVISSTFGKAKQGGTYAYFEGATPENGYVPTKPYKFKLVHGPYYIPAKSSTFAHPEGEPERHMILISFAGDESQRYVDVYQSKSGSWFTWDNSWQHLVAGMKSVVESDW